MRGEWRGGWVRGGGGKGWVSEWEGMRRGWWGVRGVGGSGVVG